MEWGKREKDRQSKRKNRHLQRRPEMPPRRDGKGGIEMRKVKSEIGEGEMKKSRVTVQVIAHHSSAPPSWS